MKMPKLKPNVRVLLAWLALLAFPLLVSSCSLPALLGTNPDWGQALQRQGQIVNSEELASSSSVVEGQGLVPLAGGVGGARLLLAAEEKVFQVRDCSPVKQLYYRALEAAMAWNRVLVGVGPIVKVEAYCPPSGSERGKHDNRLSEIWLGAIESTEGWLGYHWYKTEGLGSEIRVVEEDIVIDWRMAQRLAQELSRARPIEDAYGVVLYNALLHELGHALGLGHAPKEAGCEEPMVSKLCASKKLTPSYEDVRALATALGEELPAPPGVQGYVVLDVKPFDCPPAQCSREKQGVKALVMNLHPFQAEGTWAWRCPNQETVGARFLYPTGSTVALWLKAPKGATCTLKLRDVEGQPTGRVTVRVTPNGEVRWKHDWKNILETVPPKPAEESEPHPRPGPEPEPEPQPKSPLCAFDADQDERLSDEEFFALVDAWVQGELTDGEFFQGIDWWVRGEEEGPCS